MTERHDMILAAESEFSETAVAKIVDDDFQKLVYFKTPVKILIFRGAVHEGVVDHAMRFLREYPRHLPGELYLFVGIEPDENTAAGRIRASEASVDTDARISEPREVQFEPDLH
jgi:hypothetical protein